MRLLAVGGRRMSLVLVLVLFERLLGQAEFGLGIWKVGVMHDKVFWVKVFAVSGITLHCGNNMLQ